jgi:sialidase-1
MEQFRKQYDWSLYAFGPGHGIELQNGRLLIPLWLANGEGNHHFPTQVSTLVSDDGGKNWHTGEIVWGSENLDDPFAWPNETQAVELSNGSVMLNIRHNGTNHFRYVTISSNGKDHFSIPQPDFALPDSICFGSIVRANTEKDILFVNCANRENANLKGWAPREKLTVRLSEDDAKTWKYSRQLADVSGYADIAASPDGTTYYCFFEQDNPPGNKDPKQLMLAVFDRQWLINKTL